MATAIVLSATFLQRTQGSCHARKPVILREEGLLCNSSSPQHVIKEPSGRTFSRRDSIALLLQVSLLFGPSSNADAVESVHIKELKMEDLCDVNRGKRLMSSPCLGEVSGFVVAYLGAPKTSRSSLGFLGCLVFGLLFLREKQATAANAASLEDVQLRIKKAETELSSQTRSSISHKYEESRRGIRNERDISLHDALQCQLYSIKSSIVEKGKKLTANKHLLETLKQQVMSLTASVDEIRKDCSLSMLNIKKHRSLRQKLELKIESMEVNLRCKGVEIGSLNTAVKEQGQACNKLLEENVVVESYLDMLNNKVLGLQEESGCLKYSLHASNGTAGLLLKELNIAATRNETLEANCNELCRSLQHEQVLSEKRIREHNKLLTDKEKRAELRFAELTSQQDERDRELRLVNQLTSERDGLDKVLGEKQWILENLREALSLNFERLRILENEMPTLYQQLQHEQAQNATLKSARKDNTVLRELLKVLSELEGQINIEKELTERFEKELHVAHEALRLLEVEVHDLQDSMQSRLSGQAYLEDELARLNEVLQAHNQALKKEKRAAAYSRKQLTVGGKIMMGENQVMEELQKELETARKLFEDSKVQVSLQVSQLEKATGTAARLVDDVSVLKAALKEEQTQRMKMMRI